MIHPQWKTTASPEGDAASPAGDAVSPTGDLLASPNFGICDTTPLEMTILFDGEDLTSDIFRTKRKGEMIMFIAVIILIFSSLRPVYRCLKSCDITKDKNNFLFCKSDKRKLYLLLITSNIFNSKTNRRIMIEHLSNIHSAIFFLLKVSLSESFY
jgi:hypothetical protein